MDKIMGKLKHNYNSFPELQTFFINNASFSHFHQVSKNFITVSTFSKFLGIINNGGKSYNKCMSQ